MSIYGHRCTRCGKLTLDRFIADPDGDCAVEYRISWRGVSDEGYLCPDCAEAVHDFIHPALEVRK